ncbi:MAG: hypothetical protein V9G08_08620 [Dermatophilaceae bacterium]
MKAHLARLGAIGIVGAIATLGFGPAANAAETCSVWKSGTNAWSARCPSVPWPYDVFQLRLRCQLDRTTLYYTATGNIVTPGGTSTAKCTGDYHVASYALRFYDWW